MKIKADHKGNWNLLGAPSGTTLREVNISFPSKPRNGLDGNTYEISGPAMVKIHVVHADGSDDIISDVVIEWA